jgi:hypothetical protein
MEKAIPLNLRNEYKVDGNGVSVDSDILYCEIKIAP